MHLLDAHLSSADISAGHVHLTHLGEGQFSQVSLLNTRSDQWHGDISLHSIDSHPRRNQCQQFGHNFYEVIWMVVFILPVLP